MMINAPEIRNGAPIFTVYNNLRRKIALPWRPAGGHLSPFEWGGARSTNRLPWRNPRTSSTDTAFRQLQAIVFFEDHARSVLSSHRGTLRLS